MNLILRKPLVVFDLETTGLNVSSDRIVELSYVKLLPDGRELRHTQRFNPCMPIPAESTAIHHITDADVADCPTFAQKAAEVAQVFAGSDIAGFHSNQFDVPMLAEELSRAGVNFDWSHVRMVDVQAIFHKMEKRDLSAAYRFYCGKELANSHSAAADTEATLEVLRAQLNRYADTLQPEVGFLSNFSSFNRNVDLAGRVVRNEQGTEVFNFGKYKGRSVAEVFEIDKGYYGWLINGDFPSNTKDVFTRILLSLKTGG